MANTTLISKSTSRHKSKATALAEGGGRNEGSDSDTGGVDGLKIT